MVTVLWELSYPHFTHLVFACLPAYKNWAYSDQAGLDSFMFGQVSSFSTQDLYGQFFTLLIGLFIFLITGNYSQRI